MTMKVVNSAIWLSPLSTASEKALARPPKLPGKGGTVWICFAESLLLSAEIQSVAAGYRSCLGSPRAAAAALIRRASTRCVSSSSTTPKLIQAARYTTSTLSTLALALTTRSRTTRTFLVAPREHTGPTLTVCELELHCGGARDVERIHRGASQHDYRRACLLTACGHVRSILAVCELLQHVRSPCLAHGDSSKYKAITAVKGHA